MRYRKTVTLKDGRTCLLRSIEAGDTAAYHALFLQTHGESDNLLTYPDEHDMTLPEERKILA